MTAANYVKPVDDPTFGLWRIRPDGAVVAEELAESRTSNGVTYKPGDYFVYVRGARIYYTTAEMNPEIADWPKLKVAE